MPTINYEIDHPKNKDGTLKEEPRPIMVKIFWNRNTRIIKATGRKIPPKYWNFEKQIPKPHYTGGSSLKNSLTSLIGQLGKSIENNPNETLEFYKKEIDRIYKGDVKQVIESKRVTGICDIIEAYQERKRTTRSAGYIRAFTPTKEHVKNAVGNIPLEKFGLHEFEKLTEYLINKDRYNNTIHSNIKRLRTVIMDAAKRGMKVDPSYLDYVYKEDAIVTYRLDWHEVEAFAAVRCDGVQKIVKDLSLIRAYTGIRFSEMGLISKHSIKERDGLHFFDFTVFKTRKVSQLLVPEPAMNIVRSYNYNLPTISQQKHNIHIKKICEKAEINTMIEKVRYVGAKRVVTHHYKHKLITTHSFRRAFARKLYDDGVKVETVSKLLGHSDVSTTMKYIGIDHNEGHEAVAKVFNFKQMRIAK